MRVSQAFALLSAVVALATARAAAQDPGAGPGLTLLDGAHVEPVAKADPRVATRLDRLSGAQVPGHGEGLDDGSQDEGLIDDRQARRPRSVAPADLAAMNQLAVDTYRAGDLETARTHWTELLPAVEGAEKARVLYDLGNVAFRAKKPLEAVGWYTAALELAPRHEDAWTNLEHARREAGLDPADRGDLVATLRRVLTSFTRGESELLAAAAAAAWAALLALEALRGGRLWRRLAFVGGAAVLLAFAPFFAHLGAHGRDPLLSIAPKERLLALKSEPRAEAATVAEAHPGAELERLDELPGWTQVETEDGARGWVPSSDVFALRR